MSERGPSAAMVTKSLSRIYRRGFPKPLSASGEIKASLVQAVALCLKPVCSIIALQNVLYSTCIQIRSSMLLISAVVCRDSIQIPSHPWDGILSNSSVLFWFKVCAGFVILSLLPSFIMFIYSEDKLAFLEDRVNIM